MGNGTYFKVLVDLRDSDGDLSTGNVQADHVPNTGLCNVVTQIVDGFKGTPDVDLVGIHILPQWG